MLTPTMETAVSFGDDDGQLLGSDSEEWSGFLHRYVRWLETTDGGGSGDGRNC